MESRLEVLESKVAFQDATIEALNEVVCEQQLELDELKAQLEKLRQQFAELTFQQEGDGG
ncbi:MAG: SlyX family protein [Bdellovibrionales bacterium]|nr:SlyX family protein [Bdellovibrionales bacterium]